MEKRQDDTDWGCVILVIAILFCGTLYEIVKLLVQR